MRKLTDGGGLYLWVYEDGRKYWPLRYWLRGKEKSLSLGVYADVGLKDARRKLKVERRHLESNLDPSVERRADKLRRSVAAANSFESVAREWCEKELHTWVSGHADDVRRRLERNAFPAIGNRPIGKIEATELLAALRPIETAAGPSIEGLSPTGHFVTGTAVACEYRACAASRRRFGRPT